MSGVHERLLDVWLDSASELGYQAPFCQMLAADGYTILHNTRHSPIELGKDIIALAPDGSLCAYQLKGNPGGRLTKNAFSEIMFQLQELSVLVISLPGVTYPGQHRSFLVTNGEVDEEAMVAIRQLNERLERMGTGSKIEVLSRGNLRERAVRLGMALWPSELSDEATLLEIMAEPGNGPLPLDKLHRLLSEVLHLDPAKKYEKQAKEDICRRIASAAILTSIAIKSFSHCKNHFAIISAWTMYSAYVVSTCQRWNVPIEKRVRAALDIASWTIESHLSALCDEVISRGEMRSEGNSLVDTAVYKARETLLIALLSIYRLRRDEQGNLPQAHRVFLDKFLDSDFLHRGETRIDLWGEGAIPQILAYMFYLWQHTHGLVAESLLCSVYRGLVYANRSDRTALASPYYDFEAVCRHRHANAIGEKGDVLANEQFAGMSYYAEGLFYLMVQANMKQTCKLEWPDLTRMTHGKLIPKREYQYGLLHIPEGEHVLYHLPFEKQWQDLVSEAKDGDPDYVPTWLKWNEQRHILLLFIIIFPHRGTPEILKCLGRSFGVLWFTPDDN